MKKKDVIFMLLGILTSGSLGFLIAKRQYEPTATSVVIETANTILYTPTSNDNAHLMSVRFRNQAGFCATTANCPGYSKTGLFEFSAGTLYDLVSAVNTIKNEVCASTSPPSAEPPFYRAIFGIDASGKSRLIVTGLNATNAEYGNFIKIIDGHLPCPTMCDINISNIIMGTGTTRSACQ
jgi:hypothetical protein